MCKPLIRQRFHKYKTLESPSKTANALRAGYEALDLLYSASQGDHKATSHITNLLSETEFARQKQVEVQRARSARVPVKPLSKKEQKRKDAKEHEKRTLTRHPQATSILSRPRPIVKGKRRIPVLVNARGIPFLRIKKPQPKFLSDVIRSRLENRWKRIRRRERLHAELDMAKVEDHWDSLTTGVERASWGHEIKASLTDVNEKIYETDARAKSLARAMWEVVLAEREKAAEEQKHQSAGK
ncbi:putative DNA repair protein [Aspergillus candidus]|uniref:Putative DNA repair protein n=1 Tax=Aspergillus candidus TaxID=41067 RepID=A0A2I2FPE5_ASPCN|nr:putative DNA repair protein [Aspergillus candidus]PLB42490.1 putative DNA repair protein [Aspergillus candidus]